MPLKLRPLSNRVVVIPDSQKKMTDGGIHIPSTAKHVPKTGTVAAIGPGFMVERWEKKANWVGGPQSNVRDHVEESYEFPRMPMIVSPGDHICFAANAGTEVQIDRDVFIVLRETDVLAILEKEESDD